MEHAAEAPAWAAALEASGFGLFMRQSLWAYPAANLAHLLGLVLLIGPIMLFDLRVLGLGLSVALPEASRLLTPFALAGLAILALSGPSMFAADARSLSTNAVLIAKLSLAFLALANALLFRAVWGRDLAALDRATPAPAKLQAAASVALWLTVGALGRTIAYL